MKTYDEDFLNECAQRQRALRINEAETANRKAEKRYEIRKRITCAENALETANRKLNRLHFWNIRKAKALKAEIRRLTNKLSDLSFELEIAG